MSDLPPDFDPDEEQEIYELFSVLRQEVYEALQELTTMVLTGIDQRQAEEARMESPEATSILGSGLINLVNTLTRLVSDGEDEGAQAPGEPGATDDETDRDE